MSSVAADRLLVFDVRCFIFILTNTFGNLDKYNLEFQQILFFSLKKRNPLTQCRMARSKILKYYYENKWNFSNPKNIDYRRGALKRKILPIILDSDISDRV